MSVADKTTKTKMIAEQSFELSQPYAVGHVLNEAEAKTLNQVRSENIGNNVREKVKALVAENKLDEAKALVAQVDAEYVFSLATVGATRTLDPIEREANSIAKELLKLHLGKTNRKIGVPPEGETKESWADKVAAQIEKIASSDAVIAEAKKAVNQKKARFDKLSGAVADDTPAAEGDVVATEGEPAQA